MIREGEWLMEDRTVYITGAGIISAIGNNLTEVEQSLLDGRSGVGKIRLLPSVHRELPCGEVKLSDKELLIELGLPEDASYNRTALLGMVAIRQALQQSGAPLDEAYLLSGTTVGGMDRTEQHFLEMLEHDDYLDLLLLHDAGSTTRIMADYWGIPQQRTVTISTACSSAANAFIVGANMIRTGKADVVVAGGSEALSLFHLNGFNSLMILDTERCRPFDDTRKGLNLGEGAAYMVLESLESVRRRGGKCLAVLSGYGNRCDAFHQTASSADGEGARLAMEDALGMAGLTPGEIDYVNAHGTGTPNNDLSESMALKRVFADAMPFVSSTKSFTGHTTSASGGIELVICLLALLKGFVPGNLGWKHPMPEGVIPTLGEKDVVLKHVMCNSFGFGGNDSSLILSRVEDGSVKRTGDMPDALSMRVSSVFRSTPEAPLDNVKEFIKPMEARRLGKLQRAAMATSFSALREASIGCPDAIVVATSYGMLENSEKFLLQLCREGEQGLSPTLFMQSTHNTIAASLAIHTRCHGYNITYTQLDEEQVLEQCLQDVEMLMQEGKIQNALVGYHNEVTPALHDMMLRLRGEDLPVGVTSVAMVISKQ